ncbi:hypothetical protein GX411_06645 [Candidatus Fermentibacteria bacterium]|nr:hypothetical protein [Candidatus Fermentibacteria bacterium]
MNWKSDWKALVLMAAAFAAAWFLPVGRERFDGAVLQALALVRDYARLHVLMCLVPALFIAGGMTVFLRQASVLKYLGAQARKVVAYGVASVSGTILAVCSCTVLPIFAGIYRMGAGLGPACAFLYSGPAINVLAIVLTARVLGLEMGIARAAGAVVFSLVIGLTMHLIFLREERRRVAAVIAVPEDAQGHSLGRNSIFFALLAGILLSATWGGCDCTGGTVNFIYGIKWYLASAFAAGLGMFLVLSMKVPPWKIVFATVPVAVLALLVPGRPVYAFTAGIMGLSIVLTTTKGEASEWFSSTFGLGRQILPLLLGGVMAAGFLMGGPGGEGVIPARWVADSVGGNSITANLAASLIGAFMYFATLTEVPILQGLLRMGMGRGPALALLLAGPALSLPSMLVIRSIMGWRKTAVYVLLVVTMATVTGIVFGSTGL